MIGLDMNTDDNSQTSTPPSRSTELAVSSHYSYLFRSKLSRCTPALPRTRAARRLGSVRSSPRKGPIGQYASTSMVGQQAYQLLGAMLLRSLGLERGDAEGGVPPMRRWGERPAPRRPTAPKQSHLPKAPRPRLLHTPARMPPRAPSTATSVSASRKDARAKPDLDAEVEGMGKDTQEGKDEGEGQARPTFDGAPSWNTTGVSHPRSRVRPLALRARRVHAYQHACALCPSSIQSSRLAREPHPRRRRARQAQIELCVAPPGAKGVEDVEKVTQGRAACETSRALLEAALQAHTDLEAGRRSQHASSSAFHRARTHASSAHHQRLARPRRALAEAKVEGKGEGWEGALLPGAPLAQAWPRESPGLVPSELASSSSTEHARTHTASVPKPTTDHLAPKTCSSDSHLSSHPTCIRAAHHERVAGTGVCPRTGPMLSHSSFRRDALLAFAQTFVLHIEPPLPLIHKCIPRKSLMSV
ncbi:hypothetical protein DFH06DRAFT_1376365 [Mycena polygramma]|nr:hypothetical protein DFH06DRAFT_1376365 [Mycena polygramma]